ncbi:MAG: NADH-quinone oxidoreductase subunit J [Anaerolineae bacterium]|nr:MAG: NADH-quinone oxidoreductase subunit J [Anaerolineae bacterium]
MDVFLFLLLALIAVAAAVGMLLSKNTVHAALFLVLNFATLAVFYLILGGPFISMAQITVYTGAIMVLFLFVIMLLGVERLRGEDKLSWQYPLALVLGALLLAESGYFLFFRRSALDMSGTATLPDGFGGAHAIADTLFSAYALPVEIAGVLLLVAMVGVIVLTKWNESRR